MYFDQISRWGGWSPLAPEDKKSIYQKSAFLGNLLLLPNQAREISIFRANHYLEITDLIGPLPTSLTLWRLIVDIDTFYIENLRDPTIDLKGPHYV